MAEVGPFPSWSTWTAYEYGLLRLFYRPLLGSGHARCEGAKQSSSILKWRQLSGYHRQSRVEIKMHCVKLLGQRRSARDFDWQVAKIQIRAVILNGFTALGIPQTEAVARIRLG